MLRTPALTNAEYHGLTTVISKSHLDEVNRSPAHYWSRYVDPAREPEPPTDAMQLGTALHTAVLEPELWDEQIILPPVDAPRRPSITQRNAAKPSAATLEAIEFWDAFDAAAASKIVLSREDAERVQLMAHAVRQHPAAAFLLGQGGVREQSYLWTDPATGLECKCRPDWHSADRRIIADVKTTEDASPRGFAKSVANFRYHVQAAFYGDALGAEQFLFIAVEKRRPYLAAVYAASSAMVEQGRAEAAANMRLIAECRSADQWPGYSDTIELIDLPRWAQQHTDSHVLEIDF
jgi:hypothetical protein